MPSTSAAECCGFSESLTESSTSLIISLFDNVVSGLQAQLKLPFGLNEQLFPIAAFLESNPQIGMFECSSDTNSRNKNRRALRNPMNPCLKLILIFLSVVALTRGIPNEDQLALASSLIVGRDAYSDIYEWKCKVCDSNNKPIHAHVIEEQEVDIKAIITVYPEFIILAFRYTNTALNVWQDILYPFQINQKFMCPKCKVQKAYYNMWNNIKKEVISDLKQMRLETGIQDLIVTGISLGGGLAAISFVDIVSTNNYDSVRITTFGAPRVGNNDWADYFDHKTNKKMRRFVVDGDPIAVLPQCLTPLCSYKQTGIRINCYDENDTCIQEEETPDSKIQQLATGARAYGKVLSSVLKKGAYRSIVDHIEGYPKIYNSTLITDN